MNQLEYQRNTGRQSPRVTAAVTVLGPVLTGPGGHVNHVIQIFCCYRNFRSNNSLFFRIQGGSVGAGNRIPVQGNQGNQYWTRIAFHDPGNQYSAEIRNAFA